MPCTPVIPKITIRRIFVALRLRLLLKSWAGVKLLPSYLPHERVVVIRFTDDVIRFFEGGIIPVFPVGVPHIEDH